MKKLLLLVTTLLATLSPIAHCDTNPNDSMLLTRTDHNFKDTLEIVKKVLHENGFEVAHVQRCDGGLKHMGYDTDKYRVVFFGRIEEVRKLSKEHVELIPFFPFKVLVYAEGDQSVVSIMNPESLKTTIKDKALNAKLEQWKNEFVQILEQTQNS